MIIHVNRENTFFKDRIPFFLNVIKKKCKKFNYVFDLLHKIPGNNDFNKSSTYLSYESIYNFLINEFKHDQSLIDNFPFIEDYVVSENILTELNISEYKRINKNDNDYIRIGVDDKNYTYTYDVSEAPVSFKVKNPNRDLVLPTIGVSLTEVGTQRNILVWGNRVFGGSDFIIDNGNYLTVNVPSPDDIIDNYYDDYLIPYPIYDWIHTIVINLKFIERQYQRYEDRLMEGALFRDFQTKSQFTTFIKLVDNIYDFGGSIQYYHPSFRTKSGIKHTKFSISLSLSELNNSTINTNEMDGHSIIFKMCKAMFKFDEVNLFYYFSYFDDGVGSDMIRYFDIYTEMNRRYSAIVTTEPWLKKQDLFNNSVVDFAFINTIGNHITNYYSDTHITLKLKTSKRNIDELDRKLQENIFNTDIMDVVTVDNIEEVFDKLLIGSDAYSSFGSDLFTFLDRQIAGVDDLLTLPGLNSKRLFCLESVTDDYIDKMYVNGLGYSVSVEYDENGDQKSYGRLHVYCSNFKPLYYDINTKTWVPGTEEVLFGMTDSDIKYSIEHNEKLRPMLLLPGMNGYVKILRKSKYFKPHYTKDGDYISYYDVEFPYCAGSLLARTSLNFGNNNTYYKTKIVEVSDYVSSGPYKYYENLTPNNVCDKTNRRLPGDFFTYESLASNISGYDTINKYGCVNHLMLFQHKINKMEFWKFGDGDYGQYYLEISRHNGMNPEYTFDDVYLKLISDNKNINKKPYIGNEIASLIFYINIETMFNDMRKYAWTYESIPEQKRLLSSYLSAFLKVFDLPDQETDSEVKVLFFNYNTNLWDEKNGYIDIFTDTNYINDNIIKVKVVMFPNFDYSNFDDSLDNFDMNTVSFPEKFKEMFISYFKLFSINE